MTIVAIPVKGVQHFQLEATRILQQNILLELPWEVLPWPNISWKKFSSSSSPSQSPNNSITEKHRNKKITSKHSLLKKAKKKKSNTRYVQWVGSNILAFLLNFRFTHVSSILILPVIQVNEFRKNKLHKSFLLLSRFTFSFSPLKNENSFMVTDNCLEVLRKRGRKRIIFVMNFPSTTLHFSLFSIG